MAANHELTDVRSDYPADVSMDRFRTALADSMKLSKANLNRILAEDEVTPLAPQKRGRKPKSTTPHK